jgi:hypothetical protein
MRHVAKVNLWCFGLARQSLLSCPPAYAWKDDNYRKSSALKLDANAA